MTTSYIQKLRIQGYKCFKDTQFTFKPLQVIVGANGSGKSNLLDFLGMLREISTRGFHKDLLDTGSINSIFHPACNSVLAWEATLHLVPESITYIGKIQTSYKHSEETIIKNSATGPETIGTRSRPLEPRTFNDLAAVEGRYHVSLLQSEALTKNLYLPSFFILSNTYKSVNISKDQIKVPQLVSDDEMLDEDYKNISSFLAQLKLRKPTILTEIESVLASSIPGFEQFTFRTEFGAGKVMAFYKEKGSNFEYSLDGLSEGTICLLCWLLILLNPSEVPRMLLFDEPDLGLHPRTMTLLAALIQKASFETQVIVITHNSYFLSLFEPNNIAVMKREKDNVGYYQVENSKVLKALLDEDFGGVQELFLTGELDSFSSDE